MAQSSSSGSGLPAVGLCLALLGLPAWADRPSTTEPDGTAVETAPIEPAPPPVAERDLPDRTETVYSSPEARDLLRITVYQGGGAAFVERREIGLRDGRNEIMIGGLPATLRPESVSLESEHVPDVLQTRFTRGDLTEDRLLDVHLGRPVQAQGPRDDALREGRLVGVRSDHVVVEFTEGVEALPRSDRTRITFPELPPGLRGTPTLDATLESERGGTEPVTLAYRADGLSWTPHYRLLLAGPDATERSTLTALASIEQQTGIELPGARVRLVSARVDERPDTARALTEGAAVEANRLEGRPTFEVETPLDLRPGGDHQVRLFEAEVETRRAWSVEGHAGGRPDRTRSVPVQGHIHLEAPQDLPEGRVLVQARIRAEAPAEPIGSAALGGSPAGSDVRLDTGADPLLRARRTLQERRGLEDEDGFEAEWAIELKNHSDAARPVEIRESMPGDWELTDTSIDPEEQAARMAAWRMEVPAGAANTLRYRVRVEED